MAAFRRDLQPDDQSSAANAYRHTLQYNQDDLSEEVRKLRKDAKSTYNRLRVMISDRGLKSIDISTRCSDLLLVELVIFGCTILLLPGLFPPGYNTNRRFSFLRKELSLLEALKKKLREGERPVGEDAEFLEDLKDNTRHGAWVMTLVMTVKTFRTAK